MRWLSVVMPVRNEAAGIIQVLEPLQGLRDRIQIIVVDGGSTDGTPALAAPLVDRVMESAPGRARQMNAGAAAASGEVLLFLHADTQLPEGFDGMIRQALGVVAAGPQAKGTTPLSSNATMDPRVREDDVGGERGVVSPDSSLSKTTVIPASLNVIPAKAHCCPGKISGVS
ncbi:MAG: glycosyltransferase [Pseudomonas sp.]|nr:glycosyltransferase [Pseudomonas sp.]